MHIPTSFDCTSATLLSRERRAFSHLVQLFTHYLPSNQKTVLLCRKLVHRLGLCLAHVPQLRKAHPTPVQPSARLCLQAESLIDDSTVCLSVRRRYRCRDR